MQIRSLSRYYCAIRISYSNNLNTSNNILNNNCGYAIYVK